MSVDSIFKGARAKTILAPMAGYTDYAFRNICRRYGAVLTVTEMISSKALVMNSKLTRQMLHRSEGECNSFCQIFGHEPDVMAESVCYEEVRRFDGVDINMGCPVKKIVSNGDGSALMENPSVASKCIGKVKLALGSKPLSVKFRLGISDGSLAADFAKMCADSGADFITVHFRTRKQMYSGEADFSLLPKIVKCGIPVFANGDIVSREKYLQLLDDGAYGVSVGRGALGRPYVFSQIADIGYDMNLYGVIKEHADRLSEIFEDRVVANEMKKHVAFYLKGKRNAKNTIVAVNTSKSTEEIMFLIEEFLTANPQYKQVKND